MRAGIRERSLKRMDEFTAYYSMQSGVLGVAAYGSNANRERFDDDSDLDFLVLCESGAKAQLLEQIGDLSAFGEIAALRIVYGDAVQVLFSDGVLCDYGIVTPDQLGTFPHGAGRYLWRWEGWNAVDLGANEPERKSARESCEDALFSLYVGLLRLQRGEVAAAFEEIQLKAAKSALDLIQGASADVFSPLRRAEQAVSKETLLQFLPGYGKSALAAQAILKALTACEDWPLYGAVRALLRNCAESKPEQEMTFERM